MSGGLLEKAKKQQYQDSVHQGDNVVNDPDAIITAYEKGKKAKGDSDEDVGAAADAVIESGTVKTPSSGKGNLFLYVAVGSLLISMVLLYMLSSLPDFSGFAVLVIFMASFAAAWMHVKEDRNGGTKPTGIQVTALIVAYILIC